VSNIARWNGSAWESLGGGLNSWVRAIAVSPDYVCAAGDFSADSTGTIALRGVARWKKSSRTWEPLGDGLTGSPEQVNAAVVAGTDVYFGGRFTAAWNSPSSSLTANNVARWDTLAQTWSSLGIGIANGVSGNYGVASIAVHGSDVYVGGSFTSAGGNASAAYTGLARWNKTANAWSSVGTGIVGGNSPVFALAANETDLFVGGDLTSAGGTPAANIARWNFTAGL